MNEITRMICVETKIEKVRMRINQWIMMHA